MPSANMFFDRSASLRLTSWASSDLTVTGVAGEPNNDVVKLLDLLGHSANPPPDAGPRITDRHRPLTRGASTSMFNSTAQREARGPAGRCGSCHVALP